MNLTEINRLDIIKTFGSLNCFYTEINKECQTLYVRESIVLKNICLYYKTIFEIVNYRMEGDVVELKEIALSNIEILNEMYKKRNKFIFKYLSKRISDNIFYMQNRILTAI